jgi:hypothetical protein
LDNKRKIDGIISIIGIVIVTVLLVLFIGAKITRYSHIHWYGSEMPIQIDDVKVILPNGGLGRKTIGGYNGFCDWKWVSENQELEVRIVDYNLVVNGLYFGKLKSNDNIEIDFGPKVIVNNKQLEGILLVDFINISAEDCVSLCKSIAIKNVHKQN